MNEQQSMLTDEELLDSLHALVRRDAQTQADLLRNLAEVERRRLYLGQACSSLYTYCTERLGMSEAVAYDRIRVMRTARELPMIFSMVERGEIHLSALRLLCPHLTDENHRELLSRAAGQSKKVVEALVAEIAPQPGRRSRIRMISKGPSATAKAGDDLVPGPVDGGTTESDSEPDYTTYEVQFTGTERFSQDLERLRNLLSNKFGHVEIDEAIEYAVAVAAEELEVKRLGTRSGKRAGKKTGKSLRPNKQAARTADAEAKAAKEPQANSTAGQDSHSKTSKRKYPTRSERRHIHERDGHQCTFTDEAGHRCSEKGLLHVDHIQMVCRNGGADLENLRLLCSAHNQYLARLALGQEFIEQRRRLREKQEAWLRTVRLQATAPRVSPVRAAKVANSKPEVDFCHPLWSETLFALHRDLGYRLADCKRWLRQVAQSDNVPTDHVGLVQAVLDIQRVARAA
jgi:hypothetical protein